ncbi:DUF3073 domain-containing protein [Corynebacterium mendelii]|uniref:DUF3073 domain-containing protein n=1 Tax=Corynebacterium mendelii TaxID=2765362 RepID=A0A939E227_9CORY|nr:DUF3073 domain-containing protein [Corynebacterium mendelii]MBN9645030.1 DUF3073 domain-containing protein [Corynebacterium mendelii]
MGRGRAKAKQAKVARKLKYDIPDMDLDSLQRELKGDKGGDDHRDSQDDYTDWQDWDAPEDR